MSLEAKQIHPAVQKALYRKIDGLNKLFIGSDKPIHTVSTALDVANDGVPKNPIEQQMVRMCWARVTAAVKNPDRKGLDGLSDQPIYFSSYIEQSDKGRLVENANRPLTYNKRSLGYNSTDARTKFGENQNSTYRGETGITEVSVDQLSFFVKKMTISFSCPDPIDFEERIQPIFLRHGQYCAVEFGWGMNDVDIKTPPLSFDDIQKLNSSIKERNLALAGNYQCDVGIVSNYTFELDSDGGYTGTIDILTRGQNILNQTSQNDSDISRDVLSVQTSIENLKVLDELKKELNEEDLDRLSTDEKAAILGSTDELDDIQRAKITYKTTMLNLDAILDSYLTDVDEEKKLIKDYNDNYSSISNKEGQGRIKYRFKKGALKTQTNRQSKDLQDLANDKYFMSWGWFEDHILNSFFSIDINITKDTKTGEKQTLQSIRSVTDEGGIIKSNKCHISKDLYTKGLDSVILPNRVHESVFDPSAPLEDTAYAGGSFVSGEANSSDLIFFDIKQKERKLAGVQIMFEIINEKFKSFIPGNGDRGLDVVDFGYQDFDKIVNAAAQRNVSGNLDESQITYEDNDFGLIRNMVFPIGKFQQHFTNMETLKQGLRSFWSDVQNEYGSFWAFGISQDQNSTGRIGVYDLYYNSEAEKVDLFVSENQSTRDDFVNYNYKTYNDKSNSLSTDKTEKIFTFPLYSKNSFVKDFGLTVKMSSKAATIAAYGGNTNVATGTQRSGDLTELSLTAYSLLLNPTRKEKTKSETLSEIRQTLKDGLVSEMSFPVDDDMIGKGTNSYDKNEVISNSTLNDEGIDFHNKDIKFKEETLEILKRIENLDVVSNSQAYYDWYKSSNKSRLYDVTGNMKSTYVRTMLFLINTSLFKGDESNIQMTKPVIPIDINMTIDGVGGLKPFDLFRLDYLPEIYRNYTYFQIFDVGHTITPSGWETKLTAKMKLDLPKYLKDYPGTLKDKITTELFFDFRNEQQRKDDKAAIEKLEAQIIPLQEKINELRPKADFQAAYKEAQDKAKAAGEDFNGTFKVDNEEFTLDTPMLIEVLSSGNYRIIKLEGNPNYKPLVYLGETLYYPKDAVGLAGGHVDDVSPQQFVAGWFKTDYQGKIDKHSEQIDKYNNDITEINQRLKTPISSKEYKETKEGKY